MTEDTLTAREVGLALSGGGTRAMAFHAGVLRLLAERGICGRINHISSVSGGSLLTGLIFKLSDWGWPAGEDYTTRVFPEIRRIMTETDLGTHALRRLMLPANWKYLLSRANMVAQAIETLWSIKSRLADLPNRPVWSVNATTSETGRRFRFKESGVGDYELGYAAAVNLR
jgi:NTE family protein